MSLAQPSPTQIPIFETLSAQVAKFHPRWIQWFNQVDLAVQETQGVLVQSNQPGSFTIPTESSAIVVRRLTLAGTDRLTIQGTGRLRITT